MAYKAYGLKIMARLSPSNFLPCDPFLLSKTFYVLAALNKTLKGWNLGTHHYPNIATTVKI